MNDSQGFNEAAVRTLMSTYPTWVQDDCIEWARLVGWRFTGAQAVLNSWLDCKDSPRWNTTALRARYGL